MKKLFNLISIFILCSGLAFANPPGTFQPLLLNNSGPIVVTNVGTASSNLGTTTPVTSVTIPAGSLIVALIQSLDSGFTCSGSSVTDTASNSYSVAFNLIPNNTPASSGRGCLVYAYNSISLNSGTITFTHNNNFASLISIIYATNVQTSSTPLDGSVSSTSFGLSTSPTVTSGSPSTANELFICALTAANNGGGLGSFTQDTVNGWAFPPTTVTLADATQVNGGNLYNISLSAKTCSPTYSVIEAWAIGIAGFKHN